MPPTGPPEAPQTFSGRVWTFSDCIFDDARLELRVAGKPVDLELKPLEVLLQLLTNAGKVVTKEALLDSVWPGLMVVDGSLATAVSKLRKALGDADSNVVLTVPRVGYRIGVPVASRPAAFAAVLPEPSLKAGDSVPGREHWRLLRPLGEQQSKQVWLAENPKTRETRVFKFVSSEGRLRSLKREVTVSRFLHETIGERADLVRLLEWNFEAAPYSIESEFGGENLEEWAATQGGLKAVPQDVRLRLLADVANAVAAAHAAGVLHRDLKPTNILVKPAANGNWQIKVADFGSAWLAEPDRLGALGITNLGMTQTCSAQSVSLTGTLLYLAPEVLSGSAATAAADVYALGVMLFQLAAGDFHKPLSLGWEASIDDPVIREDIALAACGDPAQRLASPAELAERLSRLAGRRTEREQLALKNRNDQLAERKQAEARVRRPWVIAACTALLVGVVATAVLYRKVSSSSTSPGRTVAVLPFQDFSTRNDFDFLRLALADEVATTLSRMRPLTIRPFASTSRFTGPVVDLQKAGREVGANSLVTGHYVMVGDELQITMEAVEVEDNRLLWRDTVNVPAKSLLMLQAQIAAATRGKLAPVLGASVLAKNVSTPPKNEEAYGLFLRANSLGSDPQPNREALQMLERSVLLDPTHAPAWGAISNRSYHAARFGGGGDAMLQRSDEAGERALALDPDYQEAAAEMILHNAERGKLAKSYKEAQELVNRHPDNANAHHLLSYVLRYAGHVDEASRHCEMAHLIDPQTLWNSCGITFIELGNYQRARSDFVRKDHSSEWSKAITIELYMREGKRDEAIGIGPPAMDWGNSYKMLLACAQHRPQPEIAALVLGVKADDDPEATYLFAGHLSYCGHTEEALRFLKNAIDANYCSYPVMETDPMLTNVRGTRQFAEIRAAGIACQKAFDNERASETSSMRQIGYAKPIPRD